MKNLIVANWKMNPLTAKEAKQLFDAVKKGAKSKNADVVICPPFVYLGLLERPTLSFSKGIYLGAQNISFEEKGAFTGEISALQLKDLKVEYVIVGHSERRKYFSETDQIVNGKFRRALYAGLEVILCIGETAQEKNDNKTEEVLERQLKDGLAGVGNLNGQMMHVSIAYEPVWAIGTGNNCSVDQTKSAILFIRKCIENLYREELSEPVSKGLSENIKILYGGSVNSTNSADYLKNGGVNGLLVGGASLNAEEFIKIVKSAE